MATGDTYATGTNNEISEINAAKLLAINEQKMCYQSFILRIRDEISVSCNIPVELPTKNLLSIISRCKEWFYKNYEYSVEESYLFIDRAMFDSDQFKSERSITLPNDVFSIINVNKSDTDIFDIGKEFIRYSNTYVSYGVENTFEDLLGYVAAEKYESLRSDILTKKWTAFSFNNLTHKFRLAGEANKYADLILTVYRIIPDCDLFSDEAFFRYVVANAQKNIALVLGLFAYNLPGNITINYDIIQSMGQEAIDKIEESIKAEEGVDYFLMS